LSQATIFGLFREEEDIFPEIIATLYSGSELLLELETSIEASSKFSSELNCSSFDQNPTGKFWECELGFGPTIKSQKEKPGFHQSIEFKKIGEEPVYSVP